MAFDLKELGSGMRKGERESFVNLETLTFLLCLSLLNDLCFASWLVISPSFSFHSNHLPYKNWILKIVSGQFAGISVMAPNLTQLPRTHFQTTR